MYRKALIAIAVGSIVGAAAQAAGEQPVAISSPDSQTPPVNVTGANGRPITPQTSGQTSAKSTTQMAGASSRTSSMAQTPSRL